MTCTGDLVALGVLGWAGLALGIVGMAGAAATLILAGRGAARRRGETWHGSGNTAWSGDSGSGDSSPGSDGQACGDGSPGGGGGGGDCADSGGGDGGGGGGSD